MPATIPSFVRSDLVRLGVSLDAAALDRLARYLDHMLDANRHVNLTAVRDAEQAWRRHIIDSLTVLPGLDHLPPGARVVDVGSGGGLPGVPIAIALPKLSVTLIEATGKKIRFLENCRQSLTLDNLTVVQGRAETLGQNPAHRARYDVATCRAIGPMNVLLEYLLPLVKTGGRVLAMKGPSVANELDQAADALAILGAGEIEVYQAYPEGFNIDTVIVCITKHAATPGKYPRLPGVPKQSPL